MSHADLALFYRINKLEPLTRLILYTWDKISHLPRAFTCK